MHDYLSKRENERHLEVQPRPNSLEDKCASRHDWIQEPSLRVHAERLLPELAGTQQSRVLRSIVVECIGNGGADLAQEEYWRSEPLLMAVRTPAIQCVDNQDADRTREGLSVPRGESPGSLQIRRRNVGLAVLHGSKEHLQRSVVNLLVLQKGRSIYKKVKKHGVPLDRE